MPPQTPTTLVSRVPVDQREKQIPTHKPVLKRPSGVQLHHLLIAQLDVTQDGYSTTELASLLGVGLRQMAKRISQRFPRKEGEPREVYRLDFRSAVLMIRSVCQDGKKLPDLDQLYCDLITGGVIDLDFPQSSFALRLAEQIFTDERQRLFKPKAA